METHFIEFPWIHLVWCTSLMKVESTVSFALSLLYGDLGSIGDTSESVFGCFCELINNANN